MTAHVEQPTETSGARQSTVVWDRVVRFFHWSVALLFFVTYFSEDELLTIHVWAGYTIGVLVLMRIAWGFVGPTHARFSDFVTGPWTAWRYLLDLFALRAKRHLGHSPAGGVMVLLLLASLLATVWSGMELHAIENNAGPLAAATMPVDVNAASSWSSPLTLVPVARADEDEDEDERSEHGARPGEGFWEAMHELLANMVMALVVVHVLGVILASIVHRENLVGSMLTGSKRVE